MTKLVRFLPIVTLLLALTMDLWLVSLRCSYSPAIDWSRFGFAIVLQAAIVIGAYVARTRIVEGRVSIQARYIAAILGFMALTFVLVRQPVLLSDTIRDKFYASGSYQCQSFPAFWKMGPRR